MTGNVRSIFIALAVLLFWTLVGTVGFMLIESWSMLDSLYMTVITISTVGFGEIREMSQLGRAFTIVLIVGGWITSFYALARIGQALFEGGFFDVLGHRRRFRKIMELEDHYIVCGFGRMGKGIIAGLREQSHPFVIVDADSKNAEYFKNENYLYVTGDATSEATLKEAGIDKAKVLFALLPSDADNLYLTIAAKELNKDVFLIVRAIYDIAEKRLKKSGADLVISPYKVASVHALHAAATQKPGLSVDLGTSAFGVPLSMQEFVVGDNSSLVNQTIVASKLKSHYNVLVVGIKKLTGEVCLNPEPHTIIQSGDTLVVAGENIHLLQLSEVC